MARIGHEGARIGKHAHEARQQPHIGKRVHLQLHALFLIQEPPAAAELHLARRFPVLEVADHGGEGVVVHRVDVIEDGLRQGALLVEAVQEIAERIGLPPVAHGVEAGVGPDLLQQAGVVAAAGAQVQLHGPAVLRIQPAQEQHHAGGEPDLFVQRGRLPGARFRENLRGSLLAAEFPVAVVQAVVGKPAPHPVEVLQAPAQGLEEIDEAPDLDARRRPQPLRPGVERGGQVNVQRLVGPERGEDTGLQPGGGNLLVMRQIIGRVVGGAQRFHPELAEDPLGAQLRRGQQFIGPPPHVGPRAFVQQAIDAEVACQLQVGPVVERVAQGVRRRPRPGHELLKRLRVAGHVALLNPVGAHGPPLVMVAFQPRFGQVVEAPVLGDLLGRQMAVVIEDRLFGRKAAVQPLGRFVAQQEIVMDEGHVCSLVSDLEPGTWDLRPGR